MNEKRIYCFHQETKNRGRENRPLCDAIVACCVRPSSSLSRFMGRCSNKNFKYQKN